MEHPSEHSIELHILHGIDGTPEQERIEAHLKVCAGCRDLADAVSSFYADLQVDILTRPASNPDAGRSLAMTSRRAPALFRPPFPEVPLSRVLSAGIMQRFIRAHPFVAGGGGLALVAGLAFLMLTYDLMPKHNLNPSTVIENRHLSTIDVYNREGECLWSYTVPNLGRYMDEEAAIGRQYVQVADLNGDGKNEIVTLLPVRGGESEVGNVLRILNGDGTEIRSLRPGGPLMCRGRMYPDEFRLSGFRIGDFSGSGKKEIIVVANDLQSPSFVSRYDADGKLLGTYRHFGQLNLMGGQPLTDRGVKELVLYGASDRDEGNYTAIILALDPSQIAGDGESSYSGGFGLPHSPAERYYVHIPPSEVAKSVGAHVAFPSAKVVSLPDGEGFRIVAASESTKPWVYFEYLFRSDFSVAEVKSSNETKEGFDRLVVRGRVTGSFFDDYMKVVAGEVRYWNGDRWQPRHVFVSHGRPPLSGQ
jgi:hypothetical protein